MHKVKVVGVKTLETGKFDADTATWENPCKATIKWNKSTPLTEAAGYNNQDVIIMTADEYNALTEGKDYVMPEAIRQSLLTAIKAMEAVLIDDSEK